MPTTAQATPAHSPAPVIDAVFLGGADLEMETIRAMLRPLVTAGLVALHDKRLSWGANASEYRQEIEDAVDRGQSVVLVEVADDLAPDVPGRAGMTWIDHHGSAAGRPTSLEQIFARYRAPLEAMGRIWTRDDTLVAANDRGHTSALADAGATLAEVRAIRARDRAAQGITAAEEAIGNEAARCARRAVGGRLTIVDLPHDRTATVTDALDSHLGGPGYENLLVRCPAKTLFFGVGQCIDALRSLFDGRQAWYGGDLPRKGYFGVAHPVPAADVRRGGIVHDALERVLERP